MDGRGSAKLRSGGGGGEEGGVGGRGKVERFERMVATPNAGTAGEIGRTTCISDASAEHSLSDNARGMTWANCNSCDVNKRPIIGCNKKVAGYTLIATISDESLMLCALSLENI